MTSEPIPIACSLPPARADDHLADWAAFRRRSTSIERLDIGARISAPAAFAEAARDLARRESACCAFLDIETAVADESVAVTITSANPDAQPVIDLLAGSWLGFAQLPVSS